MDIRKLETFRFDSDRTYEEFSTSHLLSEYSPSIPHDFPHRLIPSQNVFQTF